ncbi:MAG: hypothetical protein AAF410_01320 [Pseudomonadota bacterium]
MPKKQLASYVLQNKLEEMKQNNDSKKFPILLWLGIVSGFILSLAGILEKNSLPGKDVIAVVNGVELKRKNYELLLQRNAPSNKQAPSKSQKEFLLKRLIEEELFIQRAVETNFLQENKGLRQDISRAMVENIITELKAKPVAEKDLQTFYSKNSKKFLDENDNLPTFSSIHEQVEKEYRRTLYSKRINEYLDWLYQRADIQKGEL